MKKLFNYVFIAVLGAVTLTSCNKNDDFDNTAYLEAQKKAERTLDSLFSAEKIKIEEYKDEHFTTDERVEDTVTVAFQYLEKKIKRGLWYEIVTPATDETYEYKEELINSYYGSYYVAKLPKVQLKYTTTLLDGTIVQQDVDGGTYDLNTMRSTASTSSNIYNSVWEMTFSPYSLQVNGSTKVINGLTAKGLKKGTKIRVITPSYWAFYNRTIEKNASNQTIKEKIPAYSPLVYEFEVITIE